MNEIESRHQSMVSMVVKPGEEILAQMTSKRGHVTHMAMGISGEAGELLDAIKKWVMYNKQLDRENVVEELGDLEFYMQGLRHELCISREETLQYNLNKLAKRYEGYQYSDQAARDRADKV